MSTHILVTGAAGQLGLEIKNVLESLHPNVTVYATHQTLDITDSEAIECFVRKRHFTHIVNCAAYTDVERASSDIERCMDVNVRGASNLARVAEEHKIHLIHISTDYIFDGSSASPYTELATPSPLSVYGLSKLEGERAVRQINADSIVIRTSWLYSPHGDNFITKIIRRLSDGQPLRVVCDQTGTPTSAHDLAKAIAAIILNNIWQPGVYNFANRGACTWYDLAVASAIFGELDNIDISPIYTNEYQSAVVRPRYSALDTHKITKCFGITPPHWLVSLKQCINQIKIQPN